MAPLRCCSFNCRGWNNGKITLKNYVDSIDLCFVQEHWLLRDCLNLVNEISPDLYSAGVSGINCDFLWRGRPYGGCSLLYRKSLDSCVTPLDTHSDRFCSLKICDLSGVSYLLICVYMPCNYDQSSYGDYLNTLGELEGFIELQNCDFVVIVGDFNVDFHHDGQKVMLLNDFLVDLRLHARDLDFGALVNYTYERDDGFTRSWIDHVLCSDGISSAISDLHRSILAQLFQIIFLCSSI